MLFQLVLEDLLKQVDQTQLLHIMVAQSLHLVEVVEVTALRTTMAMELKMVDQVEVVELFLQMFQKMAMATMEDKVFKIHKLVIPLDF